MKTQGNITDEQLPGLYRAADKASQEAQKTYFLSLSCYLVLLVFAVVVATYFSKSDIGAIISAILFFLTLALLIALRVMQPDDLWYNGRAVAESVKTRAWRWMMRAEPYDNDNLELTSKQFIDDLSTIFAQNTKVTHKLPTKEYLKEPISARMGEIRKKNINDRIEIYKSDRIQNQSDWYSRKADFNKKRSKLWFWASVILHTTAIVMLLIKIAKPSLLLPIEVVATTASSILAWLQAKKHNELASSYTLTAHEIVLISAGPLSVSNEKTFSDYVLNTETAFSREHTQWAARKNE